MTFECPYCKTRLRLPEGRRAKQIRCGKCRQVFNAAAGAVASAAPPQAPAPAGPPPAAESEPPEAPPPIRARGRSRAPLVAGLVGAIVVAAGAVWLFGFSGLLAGSPDYSAYAPEGAIALIRFDAATLRRSQLYKQLEPQVSEMGQEVRREMKGLKLGFDDIQDAFAAVADKDTMVVVLRTTRDMKPDDLLAAPEMAKRETYEGFEIVSIKSGGEDVHIARTAARTLCLAPRQQVLKDVLLRLRKGEKPKLDDDLRDLLARVKGHDHYVAFAGIGQAMQQLKVPLPMPVAMMLGNLKGGSLGLSIGSSIDLRAFVRFAAEEQAKALQDQIKAGLDNAIKQMEAALAQAKGEQRDQVEMGLAVLKSVTIRLDGLVLDVSARVDEKTTSSLAAPLVAALTEARNRARLAANLNHLSQIGRGCLIHQSMDREMFPASLGDLFDKKIIPEKAVFVSPLDQDPPKLPNGLPCSYESCFEKYPDRRFPPGLDPGLPMAWDRKPFVSGKRCVLFFDGHVEAVDEQRFQGHLKWLETLAKEQPKRQ